MFFPFFSPSPTGLFGPQARPQALHARRLFGPQARPQALTARRLFKARRPALRRKDPKHLLRVKVNKTKLLNKLFGPARLATIKQSASPTAAAGSESQLRAYDQFIILGYHIAAGNTIMKFTS